jgi:hypothetical protein
MTRSAKGVLVAFGFVLALTAFSMDDCGGESAGKEGGESDCETAMNALYECGGNLEDEDGVLNVNEEIRSCERGDFAATCLKNCYLNSENCDEFRNCGLQNCGESDDDTGDDSGDDAGGQWQEPPAQDGSGQYTWEEAVAYCDDLELWGHSDWRLPTIDELRSFIRGCPATMTGGTCGVTDACPFWGCYVEEDCEGCPLLEGPDNMGYYWDTEYSGAPGWYWAATTDPDQPGSAWFVMYSTANLNLFNLGFDAKGAVRCVR